MKSKKNQYRRYKEEHITKTLMTEKQELQFDGMQLVTITQMPLKQYYQQEPNILY